MGFHISLSIAGQKRLGSLPERELFNLENGPSSKELADQLLPNLAPSNGFVSHLPSFPIVDDKLGTDLCNSEPALTQDAWCRHPSGVSPGLTKHPEFPFQTSFTHPFAFVHGFRGAAQRRSLEDCTLPATPPGWQLLSAPVSGCAAQQYPPDSSRPLGSPCCR